MFYKPKSITIERFSDGIRARIINTTVQIPVKGQKLLEKKLKQGEAYIISKEAWDLLIKGHLNKNAFCKPFKVLLVSSFGILGEPNQTTLSPSVGVWKLAYYLVSKIDFVDVIVCDPNLGGIRILKDLLDNNKFDVVGISIIPANIQNDLELMNIIRKIQPNSMLVAGGINSSEIAKWKYFKNLPIDALIVGQGESALEKLIFSVKEKSHYLETIRRGKSPAIFRSKPWNKTRAFDESFMLFDKSDCAHPFGYYSKILYHKFSNSCPERCFWCVSPKDGLQKIDPLKAVILLENRIHIGWHTDISFIDNNLATHYEFIKRVCEIISMKKIREVRKHGKITVNGVKNDLLDALQGAGFARLSFGIESFSVDVRKGLGRSFSDDTIEKVLSSVAEKNMQVEINLIFFSPFETNKTIIHTLQATADWVKNNCFVMVVFGLHGAIGTQKIPFGLKINKKRVLTEDGKEIELPDLFVMNPKIEALYKEATQLYQKNIFVLAETTRGKGIQNHIKSLLKCQAVADILGLSSCSSKFSMAIKKTNINRIYQCLNSI